MSKYKSLSPKKQINNSIHRMTFTNFLVRLLVLNNFNSKRLIKIFQGTVCERFRLLGRRDCHWYRTGYFNFYVSVIGQRIHAAKRVAGMGTD